METEESHSIGRRLASFSLTRRITIFVMLLTIIVVGVIAGLGIPHELFPKGYESKFLMVYVPWQNAVTQEVLDKVTLPLEEELSTVKSLKELRSYTWRTGARAFMIFKRKADMAVAYREVRDRVERAKALFPEDIEKVYIRKWDPAAMPVVIIGVVADPEQPNVYDLIQKEVLLPLERIDGVAGITIDGLEERKILIEVDKNLAESYGLNIYDMAQELSSDNFTLASGNIRNSGKKFLLRSVSVYKTREEIENRILKFPIRVKDVAR
ncbi:MAG TPA: efflux RND transporter permease subunit, partial [Verrucomicrobia bacterium]|nr:efflux RND transporter permease subunit [Verrucomicrobiota bacterium]